MDDLVAELEKMGFLLSRMGVYLRLIPRQINSHQGKRHVTTVPVKLCRASNDKRSKNSDCWFAAKSMQHAEELAVFFGSKLASFIGQDSKAHITTEITTANKQAPLLMSLKYKVQLLDHDFVIASKYKLTHTVIDLCEIQDTPVADRTALKYSGPTVIQVKSLKHTLSNASTQIKVLDSMLRSEEMCKTDGRVTKPILILMRDGHEGPQFPAMRQILANIFMEHNLDFI